MPDIFDKIAARRSSEAKDVAAKPDIFDKIAARRSSEATEGFEYLPWDYKPPVKPKQPSSINEILPAFKSGFSQSVTGLSTRGKLPINYEPTTLPGRLSQQAGGLAGDLPAMIVGGIAGSPGGPIGSTVGAFALPAALRQMYIDSLEKGEVKNAGDFLDRVKSAGVEGGKAGVVGLATGIAGKVVPGIGKVPAEIAAMVTAGAAIEGDLPEPEDFLDAALLIGTLHGALKIGGKVIKGKKAVITYLEKTYKETGKHPKSVADEIVKSTKPKTQDMFDKVETSGFAPEKSYKRPIETSATETSKLPAKRSEIIKLLQEKLDIPIRTGRFNARALGIYKPQEEVIRLKFANDIEVAAHEVGHGLQKFLWPEARTTKGGLSNKPFTPFKGELEPLATKPKSGQPKLPEGFAEFIRLYVTNEKLAREKAPRFYEHFDKLLEQSSPEAREVLFEARGQYNKWIEQPALMRVLGQISSGEKPKRPTTFTDLYTATVDDLHPLKKMVQEMAKGESLQAGKDPYKLARLSRGWRGKAEAFLEHKTLDYNTYAWKGKSLKTILEPLQGDLDGFRAYAVSKRALELHTRGKRTGIRQQDALHVVKENSKKYEKPLQELQKYQDDLLVYLRDSGVLNTKSYARMKKFNEDYVPFYRLMDETATSGTGKGFEVNQPVKGIKGSSRDIVDPLESIIKNTYMFIDIAERNSVGKALVELAYSKEGLGKYVEAIPTPRQVIKVDAAEALKKVFDKNPLLMSFFKDIDLPADTIDIFRPSAFTPKDNVISVWRNGKKKLYQVHPDITKTIKALDKESTHALIQLMSYPSKWLRAGAILSPEFIARNPARDQMSAFIYSQYGFVPGVDLAKGVFHVAGKTDMYWKWKVSGGAHSAMVSMDRTHLQKTLKELTDKREVVPIFRTVC